MGQSDEYKAPPAFQWYPKQYLGDDKVMLMDWDARAMHMHFMCIAWQQQDPCTLPDDDNLLRRWVGNPPDWETRLKPQIFRAWKLKNGRWVQQGLLREFEKMKGFSESRRRAANARWGNKRDASALHVQCEDDAGLHSVRNALQSSSSISSTEINKPPIPPAGGEFYFEEKVLVPEVHEPKVDFPESEQSSLPAIPGDVPTTSPPAPENPASPPEAPFTAEIREIFEYWRETLGKKRAILDEGRRKKVRARLSEGYKVEDLKAAIRGIRHSPHHMGENEHEQVYDDLTVVCKSAKNVDSFMELDKRGEPVTTNSGPDPFGHLDRI